MPYVQGGDFTNKAQEAMMQAQSIARSRNQQQIDSLHLLFSLLSQDESIVLTLLKVLQVDIEDLKRKTDKTISQIPPVQTQPPQGQFYLTQDLAQVLDYSRQEAMRMGDEFISVEHLFLGMLSFANRAREVLQTSQYTSGLAAALDKETAMKRLAELRGDEKITDPNPESKFEVIKKYARNLTNLAKEGKLDPVIGRESEIRRLMQILSRRTKNNPVLVGEAGVGKTAIVEGLAKKIASDEVPESLKGKEVISLDLGALIAGTKYRGEFEGRIKSLLKEVRRGKDHYILFIDELHTLVGAGAAEGAVDASNLLKPALSRGELRAIGATTLKEYQRYIEKDPALERRFQPILVQEPTVDDTIAILRGLKEKYEVHHGVKIKDAALRAAAELSSRYITDRFLPDKAVDLMDEAASALRLEIESEPAELEALKDKITKLEIEKEVLKKESDSQKRLKTVEKELADLKEQADNLKAKWDSEKSVLTEIKNIKKDLDETAFLVEVGQREADLQKVAELKYGKIPELKKRLAEAEQKLAILQKKNSVLKEEVTEDDVAEVVGRWTGIPVVRLMEEEAKKLETMENVLKERIIGQEEAVLAVANAIRRGRAGIADESRPMGVFMFLGPTGVGKTETARALAEFLFNTEKALVRLDMSEYMEKYSVSKMIGSPPGYVGYEEGGQITEIIRRRPYSVVLLDEVEKAHPDVFNILLQIFEDGRLTDAKGRMVSFKNTIIIMTSNVGSEFIAEMKLVGFFNHNGDKSKKLMSKEEVTQKVNESLKETFRPEFLNRIDEIVVFNYLDKTAIRSIVDLELQKVAERLVKAKNITLDFSKALKEELAERGFDPNLGARPLKRVIQKMILDPLSFKLITFQLKEGQKVLADWKNGEVVFETAFEGFKKVNKKVVNVNV